MANTVIQIKWSDVTAVPPSLNTGEPAYSNTSHKLFVGQTGNQVITIGGKMYTDKVDASASLNTANTLVQRDASGNFTAGTITAALTGNASTAAAWQTARDLGVSGDATGIVSVTGAANANIPLTLASTAVAAGSYGSVTQIPTFIVDAKGRLTSAANVSISTTLSTAGDSGTDSVALASDTLTFKGGDGVTTNMVSANTTLMIDVDNTVIRTTGTQTISGDLAVTGNLVISGTTITQDVTTITTEDSLIKLAANNAADALDIGFYGQYESTGAKYAGMFRDASDSGYFKILSGGTEEPSSGNTVNTAAFTVGTLVSNLRGGTVSSLTSVIAVADGGTGTATSTGTGNVVLSSSPTLVTPALGTPASGVMTNVTGLPIATGVSGLGAGIATFLATPSSANLITAVTDETGSGALVFATSPTLVTPALGTPASGVMTNVTGLPISTGVSGLGAGIATFLATPSSANLITAVTDETGTGSLVFATSPTLVTPALGTPSSGVMTNVTGLPLSTGVTGTLPVANGGTAATSFTIKGVIVSDTSSSTGALSSLASGTLGHVLQINSSGVPVFGHLQGGSF